MRRFSALQLFLLAIGVVLLFSGIFLHQIAAGWESYRYPNAVYWHGMRLVPSQNQKFTTVASDMFVVRIVNGPVARLTLYLRPDDGSTPQKMVKALCARDACSKMALARSGGESAAANYVIGGEPMQVLLIRPTGSDVWIEFNGPPEALQQFADLIDAVTTQLARRNTPG
jgi:hypothetical protein